MALARARQEADVREPRYRVAANGEVVPDIRAEAAIIYNPSTNEVLWSDHAEDQRSIASITKVMTSVVFVEHELDLMREVAIERADVRNASTTYLRAGDRLTLETLLHLVLIGSDNGAARALARVSPFGPAGFVERMNQKAGELSLQHTVYADPSGLDAANVSSAYDMARLIAFAASNDQISEIMRKSEHTVTTHRGSFNIRSTNKLLGSEVDIRGAKTGFIQKAGYCLASLFRLPQGEQLAVVVLGAKSNAARFWETRHLINWISTKTSAILSPVTPAALLPQPQVP